LREQQQHQKKVFMSETTQQAAQPEGNTNKVIRAEGGERWGAWQCPNLLVQQGSDEWWMPGEVWWWWWSSGS
jgi:hypothetical protein